MKQTATKPRTQRQKDLLEQPEQQGAYVWKVTPEEYHDEKHRHLLSSSSLGMLFYEPEKYGGWLAGDYHDEPNTAQKFGSAVDTAIFNSKPLSQRLVVAPAEVLSASGARAGKAWKEFERQHAGKLILKAGDPLLVKLPAIMRQIREHRAACDLLDSEGTYQLAIRWWMNVGGVRTPCKALFDKLVVKNDKPWCIVDLKTTRDPSPGEFVKSIHNFDYDRQAAWYQIAAKELLGVELPFVWLAVKNEYPFNVECWQQTADMALIGRTKIELALERLCECRKAKQWRSPTHGSIHNLAPLPWALKQLEEWRLEA